MKFGNISFTAMFNISAMKTLGPKLQGELDTIQTLVKSWIWYGAKLKKKKHLLFLSVQVA